MRPVVSCAASLSLMSDMPAGPTLWTERAFVIDEIRHLGDDFKRDRLSYFSGITGLRSSGCDASILWTGITVEHGGDHV